MSDQGTDGHVDVVVVGAGLAGLGCCMKLHDAGVRFALLEASDGVGGRVRSDLVDGFVLDRGFQVLLSAYPEARATLDYDRLDLCAFDPGALVFWNGSMHRVGDPRRRPGAIPAGLSAPLGTLRDKALVAWLWARSLTWPADGPGPLRRLNTEPAEPGTRERTTREFLAAAGLSDTIIDRLFVPLFAGVLLDATLGTSERMFQYVFKMLAAGANAVPANGMQAIPDQMAAGLPAGCIHLNTEVSEVRSGEVRTSAGQVIRARAVVVATDGPVAARLLGGQIKTPGSLPVTALQFGAPSAPISSKAIVLDGEGTGPVNNACVISNVAPRYAPAGQTLISASVVGARTVEEGLEAPVRAQLSTWFGSAKVDTWRLLRTDVVAHAQPAQPSGALDPPQRPVALGDGLFVCGDHRDNASIQGALVSGRRGAEAVINLLGARSTRAIS